MWTENKVLREKEEMEVKSSLRRAQSLRSVSTDHVVSWTDVGLDRRKSVSQLVAHYQKSPGRKTKEVDSEDIKHELSMQIAPIPVNENISRVETQVMKADVKDKSRVSPLSRSKSMESLPRQRPMGTTALKALFESKVTTHPESKSSKTAFQSVVTKKANDTTLPITLPNNKVAEDTKPRMEAEVNNSHDEQEKEVQVIKKSARAEQTMTRSDRRKTISGIYSEKISSPEEDKRRSVADFRDNSPLGLEKPSISVKALSALYLSKVAAAETAGNLLKPDQYPSSPTGKRPKTSKMAEGSQNSISYAPASNSPTHHLETSVDKYERAFTSPPPTREEMSVLHQRRQKCELRRLLKHTYPELKNVDSLVEKEMADILNIDPVTDTGYQSEVQSRCWLFENHEINSVDFHDQKLQMKKQFQEGDIKRNVGMFEKPTSNFLNEENKPQLNESKEETSEQSIRVDVKATCRMFDTQSMDFLRDCESHSPKKNIVSEEESGSDQNPKNDSETGGKTSSNIHHNNLITGFIGTNEVFAGVSRAKQVFETILQTKENISPKNDSFSQEEEQLKANVKNRAQMFESTPLDKISQQTKEESETMLENIQATLVSLCNFNIMHSGGTILETNEIGHVKKARYHFIQEDTQPEIDDEEIVTGSIKSIMLQMLPGTSLNPTVTFLKEDSQGNVEIQKVDVPTHQLPFTQDKECRTANVVQITEDLLVQEKSMRKGVLIQDGTTGMREITVYVLFIHTEDSIGGKELDKTGSRFSPLSLKINPEPEKGDLKTDISSSESSSVVYRNKTSNVQLCQSCTEKGDLDHLKQMQETSSDVDIVVSTGELEKTSEIIPGNVNNIKPLFSTNIDNLNFKMQSEVNKSKVSCTESVMNYENNTEESNQTEIYTNTGGTPKILQNQDVMDDGAVLQAELVDVVEDYELVNLQTAIMNLHQATIEAKALQQSVQAKLASQTNQTQQICELGSVNHEFTHVKMNNNVSAKEELSQFSETQKEEECKEDITRGSIQAALDCLGKSNFNVSKGDFRTAMIYRNYSKGYAEHKKTDVEQTSDRTKENEPSTSSPPPLAEQDTLKSLSEGTDIMLCEGQSRCENKPVTCSPLHVSVDTPVKNRKTPIGPKPAIPPKPDHLKMKSKPLSDKTDAYRLNKCQVPATSSKPPPEQIKEPSAPKPSPDPASHEVLCTSVQHTDGNEPETSDTSMSNTESPETKKPNGIQVVEETPKNSPESIDRESSTGFHGTLQDFEMKQSSLGPPVKPKRIKMAKENVKSTTDNTILETETTQEISPSPHNNGSSGETCKIDSNNCEERQDKSDDQKVRGVVRREKKKRGETEDERRQRLSVHMDEILKANVPAVMEIFDKLKKQEELKNILSKVEEIEEDTNQVEMGSLRNIFESVPDWVVPPEKKVKPKIVLSEHLGAPSEPEVMSSMEVAFGDLEKAGADIIRLKDQTLARLMDIEEAIKKALYSVSTLKSDSDIVGLSGLFRESMVDVQGSPPSGNIRKISIGSSKSPKAQNRIGRSVSEQSTVQENSELFISTAKQRSASPGSPSFISIQSAARKPSEMPSPQISPLKVEPKEEGKPQCCCSVPSDRRQCSVTKGASSSPPNPQRQVSVLEVQTTPEVEKVIGTKTIRENYERTDYFGKKFYSSKSTMVVTTRPETKTTSKKLIMSSPATSEIVTYPRINTPVIREDPL